MAAAAKPPEPPVTPGRVLRRAVARAGEALHLALGVVGIDDGVRSLDQILADLDESLLILALTEAGTDRGVAIVDLAVRDALVEVQTLGALSTRPSPPAERRVTAADAALAVPFLERILGELAKAGPGTDLPEWVGAATIAGRFGSRRVIGATLPAGDYRVVSLAIDLGGAGREGRLTLVLPPPGASRPGAEAKASAQWADDFRSGVLDASAALTAVLTRHRLSLAEAEALRPGQVLPLPGVTVGSVRLEAPIGQPLATARLGQFAGLRAVRLELPRSPEMRESLSGLAAGSLGLTQIAGGTWSGDEAGPAAGDPWAGTEGLTEAEPAPLPALDWPTGAESAVDDPPPEDDGPPGPFDAAPAEGRGVATEPPEPAGDTPAEIPPGGADDVSPVLPEVPPAPVGALVTDQHAAEQQTSEQHAAEPPATEPPAPVGAAPSAQAVAADPPQVAPAPTPFGTEPAPLVAEPKQAPVPREAGPDPDPAPPTAPAAAPVHEVDATSGPTERPEPVFARYGHRSPGDAPENTVAASPPGPRGLAGPEAPAPFALDEEPAPDIDVNGEVTPGSEIAIGLDLKALGIEEAD